MDCTYYDVVIVAVQGLPEVEVVIHILTKDRQSQLKRHEATHFDNEYCTGLGKRVVPRLRESRLLTLWPWGASSRNLGTNLLPSPVHMVAAQQTDRLQRLRDVSCERASERDAVA